MYRSPQLTDAVEPSDLDSPAIWPPGMHEIVLNELRRRCVDPFPSSATRERLMSSLERIVRRLTSVGIVGELWIDGSFCTLKENPRDIDMVWRLTASFADKASLTQLDELARVVNRSYFSLGACLFSDELRVSGVIWVGINRARSWLRAVKVQDRVSGAWWPLVRHGRWSRRPTFRASFLRRCWLRPGGGRFCVA